MERTLRCTLGSQAQNAHALEYHTFSIQQSTSTHTKNFHNIHQQNSNYTKTYCAFISPNNSQTRNTQDKTDPLTEQHIKYKDIT